MLRWRAVVFDLDGTLIDTIPLIVASHRHAVQTVLGRDLPDEVLRSGIGRPLIEQMAVFDPDRAQDLYDSYRVWNHANTAALLGRFDGVDEVLRELDRAGAAVGVATSKSRDAVDLAFSIQPPATTSQLPFGAACAAERKRPSASASEVAPIQCTSVVKVRPARIAWMCESISPGMTVRPARSIDRVAGPASARISAARPTATIRSPRTASASAGAASNVTILPSRRIVSAGCASASPAIHKLSRPARSATKNLIYNRCNVQLVSIFISLEPGGLRRATVTCL